MEVARHPGTGPSSSVAHMKQNLKGSADRGFARPSDRGSATLGLPVGVSALEAQRDAAGG